MPGEETDEKEDPSASLRPRSRHTRGPTVTGVKETLFAEEEAERPAWEPRTATVSPLEDTHAQLKASPSSSLMGQEERTDLKDLQPGSPSIMMPFMGFPEPITIIGFIGTRPPVIEIPPSRLLHLMKK